MSRYVDADALEYDTEWSEYYDGFMSYSQMAIDIAPSIDIVRCKECKHFDIEYVENEHGKDDEYPMCLRFEDYTFDVKADDFCSYGERREL